MADGIQEHLAEFLDFAWDSPDQAYVDMRAAKMNAVKMLSKVQEDAPWLTPAQSPTAEQEFPEELSMALR
jgi:D-arabinose 1-dehydrogenase